MKVLCVAHHKWDGCRCERCGTVRDRDHDWDGCTCRRCLLNRHTDHLWNGCVCQRCGHTRHEWSSGVCTLCGLICDHKDMLYPSDTWDPESSAHYCLIQVCDRCGEKVRSAPVELDAVLHLYPQI